MENNMEYYEQRFQSHLFNKNLGYNIDQMSQLMRNLIDTILHANWSDEYETIREILKHPAMDPTVDDYLPVRVAIAHGDRDAMQWLVNDRRISDAWEYVQLGTKWVLKRK